MFKLACFLSVLFPSIILISSANSNNNSTTSKTTICPTKRCPNGPNISYPFWLSQGSFPDQYCGYPEFGLMCDDYNTIFSPPPGRYYYVKDIDYKNHSLNLVDFDTANTTCPRALQAFPLGNLPLSHSPLNLNLSFYYNCSSYPSHVPDIGCLRSAAKESFVFLMGNETQGFDWSERCEENVEVTVMKDWIRSDGGGGLVREFARAMKEGFVLEWQTDASCQECEASDGYCGYSNIRKEVLCFCKDGTVKNNTCGGESRTGLSRLSIGLIAGGVGLGALLICITLCIFSRKLSPIMPEIWKTKKNDQDIEAFIRDNGPLPIKKYSYSEIKKMTNSFEFKLGEGGYGQVYKGILSNGGLVAVKLLNASKGNGEEFINEVLSICKTSHVNIVTLLGFCLEGDKKALIYEFMPNGSLEKFIHYSNDPEGETNPHLSWEMLHHIAEGIAKGLEYLHKGCNTRILHLDIKPNNILLDKNFCPKISDFGLAKLCSKTQSVVSMLDARGTIGYIAPEVWNRNFGGVSHKSDVYSYGMLVLEMVGGKHNTNVEVTHSSELYFPHWIYKHIERENSTTWHGEMTKEENELVKKMVMVGLWCIQTLPSERPPMSRVIEMLEGSLDQLQIPPKPFIFSPTKTKVESSTCSSD